MFRKNVNNNLDGYCHADYAAYLNETKAPITWASKKQSTTALSTYEAEYMSMGTAVQDCLVNEF